MKAKQSPSSTFSVTKFFIFFAASIAIITLNSFRNGPSRIVEAEPSNVISYLTAFQRIALENGGSRSVVNGHKASVSFVLDLLKQFNTTFEVQEQEIYVPVQVDEEPPFLSFQEKSLYEPRLQIATVQGSGSSWVEKARIYMISECSQEEFIKRKGDWIALIYAHASKCSPCDRLVNAIQQGASAAIFINTPGNQEGYPHPLPPRPGRCGRYAKYREEMKKIGIVSLSDDAAFDFLTRFAANPKMKVSLKINSAYRDYPTKNIIATSIAGNPKDIVMFGSHLDSVPAGPGINDDGSGAAATLELARAFAVSSLAKTTTPKIRFAWWSAEEIGLLGSKFYVKNLTENDPDELSAFRLNIDTDMIASPNWVRGVWSGADLEEPLKSKTKIITDLIVNWFSERNLPTFEFKFNGRSDFQPFLDANIPCGGIITGEDEIKSIESEKKFGGVANMVLDPCYHQDCDRVENLQGSGLAILKQNLGLLAYLLETFAQNSK